ncbi:DUF3566 domain-containing protein [Corynebacterium stationis]|uniref:DUF3566 domain-containing protein n=1 Tax=Corynebacterium stationis TaxID=1705 RepID=UPI0026113B02|nr:DUF3566 domain-containing protein [Corynebacterium stationis]
MARRNVSLKRITPLSAFRVGLAMSLVGLVAWLIAVVLLYFGMSQFGIWESMNSLIFDVGGSQKITFGMVFAICALIGVVVAIFNTILAPLLILVEERTLPSKTIKYCFVRGNFNLSPLLAVRKLEIRVRYYGC